MHSHPAGKIGEWRFDKRSYSSQPPPRNLGEPPAGMKNELVRHLIHAINEATSKIPGGISDVGREVVGEGQRRRRERWQLDCSSDVAPRWPCLCCIPRQQAGMACAHVFVQHTAALSTFI